MSERGVNRMKTLLVSTVLVLGALGCDVSSHCDPGQVYMNFACYVIPPAGAAGAGGGGSGGGGGAGDSDAGTDDADSATSCLPYQGFGDSCTVVSQCSCGLDSCNIFMNANYCTHTHCLADATICPPGWTCFDVSAFDPATGSACLRP
jgi:hypothetical protein